MDKYNLKILSDIDCNIYVDNELLATTKPNEMTIIPLSRGEYWVQCVCTYNPGYKIEQIVCVEYHKVLKLDFVSLIEANPDYAIDSDFQYIKETKSYINKLTGKEITSCIYDDGREFYKGRAKVKRNDLWGYIDYSGSEILKCSYTDENLVTGIVVATIYYSLGKFKEGVLAARLKGGFRCKYGYINHRGETVIPFMYDSAGDFHEGLARVTKNEKYGYINHQGETVIPFIYDSVGNFHEGLAWARRDGQWGYINHRGETVIPFKYGCGFDFKNGLVRVIQGGKWGVINTKGEEVIPLIYDDIWPGQSDDFIACYVNNKVSIFTTKFGNMTPVKYDSETRNYLDVGLMGVNIGNKWGCINTNGKEVIPLIFDDIWWGPNGSNLLKVKLNGKWGFIDSQGEEIIPIKYDEVVATLTEGVFVKSKFSTNNFKKIRIPQFSETRFGSFVGLFSCFYVYKQ